VSPREYNDLINLEYKALLQDVDQHDKEAMNHVMQPIRNDLALKDVEGVQDRKTVAGLMRTAKEQFTNLVSAFVLLFSDMRCRHRVMPEEGLLKLLEL
jgi:hypothetical protein